MIVRVVSCKGNPLKGTQTEIQAVLGGPFRTDRVEQDMARFMERAEYYKGHMEEFMSTLEPLYPDLQLPVAAPPLQPAPIAPLPPLPADTPVPPRTTVNPTSLPPVTTVPSTSPAVHALSPATSTSSASREIAKEDAAAGHQLTSSMDV